MNVNEYSLFQYEIVIVSDLHFGSWNSNEAKFLNFLNDIDSPNLKTLILNGDIFDNFNKTNFLSKNKINLINKIIEKIIDLVSKNIEVIYILGNHDNIPAFTNYFYSLKKYNSLTNLQKNNIKFTDEFIINHLNENFVVIHGDKLDNTHDLPKVIVKIGTFLYNFSRVINNFVNQKIQQFDIKPIYFSRKAKSYVKGLSEIKGKRSQEIINLINKKKADGLIFGHTHTPEYYKFAESTIINSGDWLEHFSYIGASKNTKFELNYY